MARIIRQNIIGHGISADEAHIQNEDVAVVLENYADGLEIHNNDNGVNRFSGGMYFVPGKVQRAADSIHAVSLAVGFTTV